MSVSLFEVDIWRDLPYSDLWSNGIQRIQTNRFFPFGIGYQLKLGNFIKIHLGAIYSKEIIKGDCRGCGNIDLALDYNVQYLKIPVGVRLYLSHFMHDEAEGGFFIQPGVNFDIAVKEDIIKITNPFYDPRFGTPPGGWPPSVYTVTETHSKEWRFHKICPSVFIGHEIVFDNISFFYGGRLETLSLHQNNILQENYENRNFSLINIGMNYRF
ncbi:MAG TPA: hypothetical protein VGC65_01845 [Bacteroidia bacterium]